MAGITLEGFEAATYDEIKSDVDEAIRAALGQNVDLSENSVLGQLSAIVSERYAELWEVAQGTYSAFDPDQAEGAALESLAALTGTVKEAATASTVTVTLTGDPFASIGTGNQVTDENNTVVFQTTEAASLNTLAAWTILTVYSVGDRVTNVSRAYTCITAGTSAGSGGPTTDTADELDGTVHWRYLGEGTATDDVAATATVTGPKTALSGTLTEIATPISGWLGAINLEDADPGANVETDPELRLRRISELSSSGSATVRAIKRAVAAVDGVTSVSVFENDTDSVSIDFSPLPAHSVEALVEGGDDQAIREALFDSVAGGIGTYGNVTGGTVNEEVNGIVYGFPVDFSRPVGKNIYVELDVTINTATFPLDGVDQIKAAIVAWGDALGVGHDVFASGASAQAFKVTGVLNVTGADVDDAPAPSGSTVTIALREKADFDTSRITINTTPGSP